MSSIFIILKVYLTHYYKLGMASYQVNITTPQFIKKKKKKKKKKKPTYLP